MKLARYEVVRELGKGAMGVVYLAKDPLIGRLVALKTIRAASGDDEEAREFQERFVREAQAAGILSHPAIVTVHDIGKDPESGISFIAMEYIEGFDLKQALVQGGRQLDHFEIAELIAQVAEALDYAHSKGIVHRDVKPANILILGDGKAKITDFGIAKIASEAGSNLTSTGQFLGTPNYMAPEQIKGIKVDGRSDIFSLGIVFYESLARRKPFGGDSLTTISYKIVHESFTPLAEIDPTIPDGFESIIARCLDKDPAKRYQRARDIANDIRAIIRGDAVARTVDPSQLDATILNREDAAHAPTMEIPFPEVDATAMVGDRSGRGGTLNRRPAGAQTATGTGPQPARGSALPPVLRTRLSPAVFFGILAIVAIPLILAMALIAQQKVEARPVDVKREAAVARQRQLRMEGAAALRQGNVELAAQKYGELSQLAPNSPFVNRVVGRLNSLRTEQMSFQQKIAEASQKFEEGRALYDKQDFSGAIPLFEEAFHLNPNMNEAVNFLKISREQLSLQQMKSSGAVAGGTSRPSSRPTQAAATTTQAPAAAAPSTFTVSMKSPVNDGYMLVKVNGQNFLYENLFEEKRSFFRKTKSPREINITREVPSGPSQIEVWVVVQSLGIQDHKVLKETLAAGSAHRLAVTLDQSAKTIALAMQ